MVSTTKAAKNYTATGDPDHVAYGADFHWTCTCGRSAGFATTKRKATLRAKHHEQYCNGDVEVDTL